MYGFPDLLYDGLMAPLETFFLQKKRKTLLSRVKGNVLEIGCGTGANLKNYPFNSIRELKLLDLTVSEKVKNFRFPEGIQVDFIEGSAEELPFPDESFDSVVFTLVFCSVPDPVKGLKEVHRVLKKDGTLFFMEHILPEKKHLDPVVHKINPLWKKIAAGCHLNRKTLDLLKETGFTVTSSRYLGGFFAEGTAQKAANQL